MLKPVTALKKFFGLHPGQTLKGFADEIKALEPGEKLELARLACEEMGEELEEA